MKTDIYDDPNNFHSCENTHPKQLCICMADINDRAAVKTLKSCPDFAYEEDYEEGNPNLYCSHCWALGFRAVCENNQK